MNDTTTQRLGVLLDYARRRSPYYCRNIPALSSPWSSLEKTPVLTRVTLRANWDEICTVRGVSHRDIPRLAGHQFLPGDLLALSTGGSTGSPLWMLWPRSAFLQNRLESAERLLSIEREIFGSRHIRRATIMSTAGHHASSQAAKLGTDDDHLVLSSTSRREDLISRLNEFAPDRIDAYPSVIRLLCSHVEEGSLVLTAKMIVSGGEELDRSDRDRVERTLGAPCIETYGATEVGMMAIGDLSDSGMHLLHGSVIIEHVEVRGRLETAVTGLLNLAVPVIRYLIGDDVDLQHGRVRVKRGRKDEVFEYRSGAVVHPDRLRAVMEHFGELDYQIVQTPVGLKINVGRDLDGVTSQKLADGLRGVLLLAGVEGGIVEMTSAACETTPSGKKNRFVGLRAS